MSDEVKLKQELGSWQIFFITISAVIGSGIFAEDGEALEVSGPGGTLLSLFIMGAIAIATMEGLSEMVQLFPAPNAIVEYIGAFVDADLGWIMGIAYWYTYASIFATQIITAANFSTYWNLSQVWQTLGFYVLAPIAILAINFVGIWLFGWIESFGGFLKSCLVVGSAVLMFVIAGKGQNGSNYINDGITNNTNFSSNHNQAVCYAIPLIAYSFLGVEVIAVTAFEAKDLKSLRRPSQFIVYVIFVFYLLCIIGELLNVPWWDNDLPPLYGGIGNGTTAGQTGPPSTSMIIIATFAAGINTLPGFLNACLIFSVLSASNTSLYVASRTLYGMARKLPRSGILSYPRRVLSAMVPRTGVPAAALLVSAISFFWLPFLQLKGGYEIQALIEIMAVSASVSCLLVWAALCLAFIRYHYWLRICRGELTGELAIYKRHDPNYRPFTLFAFAQPVPAYIGLLGSVLVVLVFTSSTWWDGPVTFGKVAIAYAAPMVLLSMWVAAKIIGRRPWVKLDEDITKLSRVLNDLQWLKPEQIQVQDMPLATLDREAGCSSRPEHHGSDQISEAPSHFLKPTT